MWTPEEPGPIRRALLGKSDGIPESCSGLSGSVLPRAARLFRVHAGPPEHWACPVQMPGVTWYQASNLSGRPQTGSRLENCASQQLPPAQLNSGGGFRREGSPAVFQGHAEAVALSGSYARVQTLTAVVFETLEEGEPRHICSF